MNLYNLLESDDCYKVPNNFKARLAKLTLSKKKKLRKSLQQNKSAGPETEDSVLSVSRKMFLELLTDDSSESEAEEINRLFLSQSVSNEMEKMKNNYTQKLQMENASISGVKVLQLSSNNIHLEISDSDATNCSATESSDLKLHRKYDFPDKKPVQKLNNIATDDTVVVSISDESEFKENINICTEIDKKMDKIVNNSLTAKDSKRSIISIDTESMGSFEFKENDEEASGHKDHKVLNKNDLSKQFSSNDSIFEEINNFLAKSKKFTTENLIDEQSLQMKNLCITEKSQKNNEQNELQMLSQRINNLGIKSPEKVTPPIMNNQNQFLKIENPIPINKINDLNDATVLTLSSLNSNSCISNSEEEESVIIVSDSDENDLCRTEKYENHVSQINATGETDLVSTMSNFKADRLQNFLKDCEIHPHEYPSNTSPESLNNSINNDNKSVVANSVSENSIEIPETSSEIEVEPQNDDEIKNKSETTEHSVEIQDSCWDEKIKQNESIHHESLSGETSQIKRSEILEQQNKSFSLTENNGISEEAINKSNSLSSEDSSPEQISVAAKINIKIQFTPTGIKINRKEAKDNSCDSEIFEENHSKKLTPKPIEKISFHDNKLPSSENIDDSAKKILNELYGAEWQTPNIIKSLSKKRFDSGVKLFNNENTINMKILNEKEVIDNDLNKCCEVDLNAVCPEKFPIVDFSLFHKNIKPELESTRIDFTPNGVKMTSKKNQKTKNKTSTRKKKNLRTRYERNVRALQNAEYSCGSTEISDDDSICQTDDDFEEDIWNGSDSEPYSENEYENITKKRSKKAGKENKSIRDKSKSDIIYLDLSNELIKVRDADECASPAANNDPMFNEHLQNLLKTCTFEKKKLTVTPINTNTKRKLFTPNYGEEDENPFHIQSPATLNNYNDDEKVKLSMPLPLMFAFPLNKKLESVKTGTPIFKIPTPVQKTTPKSKDDWKTPKKISSRNKENSSGSPTLKNIPTSLQKPHKQIDSHIICKTYEFLKSLGVETPRNLCHPEALIYRDNYKNYKNELADKLYKMYNEKLFDNKLDCPIKWNKKLLNTAGRCINKKKKTIRTSVIELSDKVLTSADRLRCTLVHELCHAATWIFNGEHGHGVTWKSWANKANKIFPELPKIGICHQYEIEYKYTYKCTLCQAKSHAHSKSKKVESIRCSYCHGAIEIFLNKKDKSGNVLATPVREPTGFAKFVRDKYKMLKTPDMKHADVMRALSSEFANLNVDERSKY